MKVSILIPVKKRLSHLKESLPLVLAQTHTDIEVIVIDWNCPEGSASWVASIEDSRLRAIKANVGEDEWSLSAARNMAFKNCSGEVVLFLDADALLAPDFLENHLQRLVPGSFLCGWGAPDATGCMLCFARDFRNIGGYNEAMVHGWGGEDIDIFNRFQHTFAMDMRSWGQGITTIKHSDELRSEYQSNKDIFKTNEMNFNVGTFKGL